MKIMKKNVNIFPCFVIIFVLVFGMLPEVSRAEVEIQKKTLSKGSQWIEKHPFQICAIQEGPADLTLYKKVGFTSTSCLNRDPNTREKMIAQSVEAGLNWQVFVGNVGDYNTVSLPRIMTDLIAKYPGCMAWSIGDESPVESYPSLRKLHDAVKEKVSDVPIMCALQGMEFTGEFQSSLTAYPDYVDNAIKMIPCDILMYDLYPFYRGGTSIHFYQNMSIIRDKALKAGLPYWSWLQSHGMNPPYSFQEPSASELRLQAFASLAYGFSGLAYWTYDSNYEPYSKVVIDIGGKPTHIYESLQMFVPELVNIGQSIKFPTSTAVYYQPGRIKVNNQWLYPQPLGTIRWTPENGHHIKNIKLSDDVNGFLLSFFKDSYDQDYMMIVNTNHGNGKDECETAGAITIEFDFPQHKLTRLNRKLGVVEDIPLCENTLNHYVLPGGTGDLFKVSGTNGFAGY